MSWWKKKVDPISEKTRSLNSEIAALEAQIKRLDAELQGGKPQSRVRSTTLQREAEDGPGSAARASAPKSTSTPREPIFENVDQRGLKAKAAQPVNSDHFNELGVRKYDATALVGRVKEVFRGSTPMNPRLVSYLAAGGMQGLQPLRREKRVARNRFIALTVILFLILLGIIFMFARNR